MLWKFSDGMPLFDAKALGARVKAARSRSGLTQAGLAEAAGVTDETVSRIERGAYEPAVSTLVALADALRVPLDVLVGRAAPSPGRSRVPPLARRLIDSVAALTPEAMSALLRLVLLLPRRDGKGFRDKGTVGRRITRATKRSS
jgi:transcriptional regulator with XRE-family HTH domain